MLGLKLYVLTLQGWWGVCYTVLVDANFLNLDDKLQEN